MQKTKLILCLCVLFFSCKRPEYKLPFFTSADFTPHWYKEGDSSLNKIHRIPDFSFTDQNNAIIDNRTVQGKVYVADFFFTKCAGICPKMTSNMNKVADYFESDSSFYILSHSVTPEVDGVNILKDYARKKNIHNTNWHLLTGEKENIYNIARRGYFAEQKDGYAKNSNEFLHTENFILVDKHGRIRGIYNGTVELEINDLIEHIKILEAED